jgi:hypothetical protein
MVLIGKKGPRQVLLHVPAKTRWINMSISGMITVSASSMPVSMHPQVTGACAELSRAAFEAAAAEEMFAWAARKVGVPTAWLMQHIGEAHACSAETCLLSGSLDQTSNSVVSLTKLILIQQPTVMNSPSFTAAVQVQPCTA